MFLLSIFSISAIQSYLGYISSFFFFFSEENMNDLSSKLSFVVQTLNVGLHAWLAGLPTVPDRAE